METIEPANLDDVPQLAELLHLLFTQEADFQPDRNKQMRGLRLLIVSLLFTVSTAEGGPACWLEDMMVRPDQRGAGLGSRLLQQAVNYARTHGFHRITLLTDRGNAGALRFYGRQGFLESEMTVLRLALQPS